MLLYYPLNVKNMCNCEERECLEVLISPGAEEIALPLTANQTGNWTMVYDFNGVEIHQIVAVTTASPIVIPNIFNEKYVNVIRFYNTSGVLFNDTCYVLGTKGSGLAPNVINGEPSGDVFNVTITADSTSFTSPLITGTVITITTDTQSLNAGQFSQAGTTIARTDGGSFYEDQIVTVQLA